MLEFSGHFHMECTANYKLTLSITKFEKIALQFLTVENSIILMFKVND